MLNDHVFLAQFYFQLFYFSLHFVLFCRGDRELAVVAVKSVRWSN
jgi:hypothetical protein